MWGSTNQLLSIACPVKLEFLFHRVSCQMIYSWRNVSNLCRYYWCAPFIDVQSPNEIARNFIGQAGAPHL